MTRIERIVEALLGPRCLWETTILLPPRYWPQFISLHGHGMTEFLRQVQFEDKERFEQTFRALARYLEAHQHPIPDGEWHMKMPDGYAILGKGSVGGSVLGKTEALPIGETVDNPVLSDKDNSLWRKTL